MCAGVEQHSAAVCVCANWTGVDTGAKHHRQGALGQVAASADQDWHPANVRILQRVSMEPQRSSEVLY